jgi:antitoxin MazE
MMQATIRKWGNSAALRLPMSALKEAAISVDQNVNIVVTRGRILIEPVQAVAYDLDDLVNAITPENAHSEVNFGTPAGQEAL